MLEEARDLKGAAWMWSRLSGTPRRAICRAGAKFETVPLLRVACVQLHERLTFRLCCSTSSQVCIVDDLRTPNAPVRNGKALARRAGPARRWRGRSFHDECAGFGEPQRSDLADHGLARPRDRAGTGLQQAKKCDGRRHTARTAPPAGEGSDLPSEKAKAESERSFRNQLWCLRELAIADRQALEARAIAKKQPRDCTRRTILVNVTAEPSTAMMLRRARRVRITFMPRVWRCLFARCSNFPICRAERQAIERHFTSPKICVSTRRSSLAEPCGRAGGLRAQQRVTQIFLDLRRPPDVGSGTGLTTRCSTSRDLEVTWWPNAAAKAASPRCIRRRSRRLNASRFVAISPKSQWRMRSASFASTRDMSR